jgi:hypothetical protein
MSRRPTANSDASASFAMVTWMTADRPSSSGIPAAAASGPRTGDERPPQLRSTYQAPADARRNHGMHSSSMVRSA